MDQAETCYFCENAGRNGELAAWFVGSELHLIHTQCWVVAYRRIRDTAALTPS